MRNEMEWMRINQSYSSVSDMAYKTLREGILTCRLAPATRVSVGELAERMGVSRTPVRDAIQRLEAEGLIVTVPRSHTYVAALSHTEMQELYAIRMMLEGPAAELAATHISVDGVERLRRLVTEAEAMLQAGDFAGFTANNTAFHTLIFEATMNRHLRDLALDLRSRCQRYIYTFTQVSGRERVILKEHLEIIEALSNRDLVRSRHLLEQHLGDAWAWHREQLTPEGSDEHADLQGDGAGGPGELPPA